MLPFMFKSVLFTVFSLLLVWPSTMGKYSTFKETAKERIFSIGDASVQIKIVHCDNSHFPVKQCSQCLERMQTSSIPRAISSVKWTLVNSSMYPLENEVNVKSFVWSIAVTPCVNFRILACTS